MTDYPTEEELSDQTQLLVIIQKLINKLKQLSKTVRTAIVVGMIVVVIGLICIPLVSVAVYKNNQNIAANDKLLDEVAAAQQKVDKATCLAVNQSNVAIKSFIKEIIGLPPMPPEVGASQATIDRYNAIIARNARFQTALEQNFPLTNCDTLTKIEDK